MSQSAKAMVQFVIVICCFVIGFSLLFEFASRDPNHAATWTSFSAAVLIGAACVAVLIRFRRPKQEAPDMLARVTSSFYERDGFCFIPTVAQTDGVACCRVWFQNNFTNPCTATVAMEPASGLFGSGMFRWIQKGNPIELFSLTIDVPSGSFGFAERPISLPKQCQGKPQKFFVGCHAKYPEGRGPRVRSGTGLSVGKSTKNPALGEFAAVAGALVISSPAKMIMPLPADVAEAAPTTEPRIVVLWRLGEPTYGTQSIQAMIERAEQSPPAYPEGRGRDLRV